MLNFPFNLFPLRMDSDEEEEADFKEKLHQWKRVAAGGSAAAGKKKVKYVYKSADQVLEEGKWRKVSKGGDPTSSSSSGVGAGSKVKVIDMTGKEERVLSGYHAIAAAKQRPGMFRFDFFNCFFCSKAFPNCPFEYFQMRTTLLQTPCGRTDGKTSRSPS